VKLRALLLASFLALPNAAKADPISALITTALSSLTTAFAALGVAQPGIWAVATLRLGGSLLLSAASNALFGPKMPKAQDLGRELAAPTTEPAYRFVYGEGRATGTPVGTPVRGRFIWGCWILNSRPSSLPTFTLYLDKRPVALSGDAFDFTGDGAVGTTHPFLNHTHIWISRGDQTSPPDMFLDEVPWAAGADEELWKATDGWQGRTVLWARFAAGDGGQRQERWPSTPPMVEVEGKWSLIYDPREGGHDPDDPDTWEWSDNHALCVLDALTQNPIRQYRANNLHMASFIDAADVSDELVDLKSGGTERRYRVAGTLAFDVGEIEDQVNPLVLSGGGNLIRIGGKLGLACGEYRAPTLTVSDFMDGGFEAQELADEHELVTTLRVSYLSPARGYETAQLKPWDIPGALAEDGGVRTVRDMPLSFCPSATQAMRIRKIEGLRMRRQQQITAILPPECFDLIGGSTFTLAGVEWLSEFDGVYEVQSINPGLDPIGESGEVAMRLPATFVLHDASIYAWDEDTEEEEVDNEPYIADRQALRPPGAISAQTGPDHDLNTGTQVIPRIRFSFDPSPSELVTGYAWDWRVDSGDWQSGGTISKDTLDGSGDVFGHLISSGPLASHDIRVWAVAGSQESAKISISGIIPGLPLTINTVTAGPGIITFDVDTPDSSSFQGVEVGRSSVGAGSGSATVVSGIIPLDPDELSADAVAGDPAAANVVVNGDFASSAGWTTPGGWSIGSGVASHAANGANNTMFRTASLVAGQTYVLSVDMPSYTAGSALMRLIGSSTVSTGAFGATGTHQYTLTAPASPTQVGILAGTTCTATFDNFTVRPVTAGALTHGEGDFYIRVVTQTGQRGGWLGPYTRTIR